MIGCIMLAPIAGFLALMGVYMTSLMAYFAGLAALMGIYMSFIASYFTAFFILVFG